MYLSTNGGREINTETLPSRYDPIFCSDCGCRVGWCDTNHSATSAVILICDECAAESNDESSDEEE